MRKALLLLLLAAAVARAGDNVLKDGPTGLVVYPVSHASMAIRAGGRLILIDPVGGAGTYTLYGEPDLVLITDIHGDHLDKATVEGVKVGKTRVVGPPAAVAQLGFGDALENGGQLIDGDVAVEAVPMYNLTSDRLERHPKGRGNGYVLTYKGKRLYISGDTEDVPEMRALKDIDYAFVCMNLPYTMSVEQAAAGVLAFKPKTVIPYHHKGSDVGRFARLVKAGDKKIRVVQLDWYAGKQD